MEWAVQCGEKRQNFWKIQLKVSLWWERKWGLSWQEKRSEMFHPGPFSLVKAKHQSKVRVVGGGQKCASTSNYLWGDKQLLVEQAGWGQHPRPHQARRSHHPAELWLLLPAPGRGEKSKPPDLPPSTGLGRSLFPGLGLYTRVSTESKSRWMWKLFPALRIHRTTPLPTLLRQLRGRQIQVMLI